MFIVLNKEEHHLRADSQIQQKHTLSSTVFQVMLAVCSPFTLNNCMQPDISFLFVCVLFYLMVDCRKGTCNLT